MKATGLWDTALCSVVDVSEVCTASIIRAMIIEAVGTSETSVSFYESTRRCIPEGCHFQEIVIFTPVKMSSGVQPGRPQATSANV
jgi:hypothetical protein